MPTFLCHKGYRLFFFSNEGNEPVHIHVESGNGYCKFWIHPLELAFSTGYDASELNNFRKLVEQHSKFIEIAWYEHFR